MFLRSSRYVDQKIVSAKARDGREVEAVTLRRLASPPGPLSYEVRGHDTLDIMADRQYGDGTMFWHIADANTELQANELVRVPGRVVRVPDK
jgi:nucleoid-associated protein YgaU